jgi:hypothetical protein
VLLVLVGAVADLAEAMDEDSPRQAVACFALVEFPAGLTAQFRIPQPVEGEQRAFQPSQLAQRRGEAVLLRVEASCRKIKEAATVPLWIEAVTRRISGQWARMSAVLMRPAISPKFLLCEGASDCSCSEYFRREWYVTGYSLVGSTSRRRKAWAWIGVGVATRVKL